jgi:hypothetical protein
MNRTAIFFLLVIAPVFAIVLALLGVESIPANPLGWFLLLVGVSYPVGVVIVVWIRKRPFWESGSGGSVVKEERNDRSYWILVLGMLVVFYLSPLEYLFVPAIIPRASGFILAGLLLVIAGAALFVWARRSLRQAYSGHISVTTQQPLVQRGPYRLIRHPAYAGIFQFERFGGRVPAPAARADLPHRRGRKGVARPFWRAVPLVCLPHHAVNTGYLVKR